MPHLNGVGDGNENFHIYISNTCSCSNTPELETGEIKTLQLLKQTFEQANAHRFSLTLVIY